MILENVCDCHWAMFKFTMKSVIRDFEAFIVENFLLCYVQTHKVEVVCWIKYNIILNLIIELKKNGDSFKYYRRKHSSFFNCCEKHFQLIMFPCHITIMSLEIILFIYSQNLYCSFTPLNGYVEDILWLENISFVTAMFDYDFRLWLTEWCLVKMENRRELYI